ncbi:response regulator [Azospirillum thermophilum]|uniref:Response regulator n=1 Tax=Azospirillum thermophilum TaxID=2202148 RepID=A0A2S2CZL2_9PROT|nr:response regulator [Azospirillum thermophilum]AWK89953.1 response regulator [Azospirillum thermophilum]
MAEYDFSQVDAAIIDTQHNPARVLREVLARLGFRRVEIFDSARTAAGLLGSGTPDLMLIDADSEEAETLRFIRAVRHELTTANPYACVIVTTWQPTSTLLMRVKNAGADDLLMKPVSPKQVQDRIASLIEARKGFVVTADYTGPDRRKAPREGTQIPVLEAPNTLRLKATGRFTQAAARSLLTEANRFVTEQKRLRIGIQIAFLIEFALIGLAQPVPERMAVEHLARVPGFIDELLRRLDQEEGDHAAVEAVGRSLRAMAEAVRGQAESGPVNARDLTELQLTTNTLLHAVDPSRPLEAMAAEVSTAVIGYRTRLEQMAQAKAAAAQPPAPPPDPPPDPAADPVGETAPADPAGAATAATG